MRLRSTDRIAKAADFGRCQKQGKRFASRRFVVLHFQKLEGPRRLGLMVSKKTGNAVVRNRWKRVIRETFRLGRTRIPPHGDEVVIVKKSVKGKPDLLARGEILSLFARVATA